MKTKHTDVVAEYLHEVDLRLAGLPVLQRRELLADLAAHIASERAERNISTEGELIEILERLGSPEVVAAAAHEEAGTAPRPPAPPRKARNYWPFVALAVAVVAVFVLCSAALFLTRSSGSTIEQAPMPAVTAPVPEPRPTS
jgi:uncharacterized membrane protein